MILQLDRINCEECNNQLELISVTGDKFPKGTIYIKNINISLKNTSFIYHTFICKNCGKFTKCLVSAMYLIDLGIE